MYEVETIQHGQKGDNVEYINEGILGDRTFDPTTILVQLLKRPSDPITKKLQNCLHSWVAAGMAVQVLDDPFHGWIDTARNWQAKLFQKATQFKYALMIDSDVGPPHDLPIMLSRHDLPVVSAVVCSFTAEKGLFICATAKDHAGKVRWITLNGTKKFPKTGLIEVVNVGTGCVMVRRDVMEHLWQNYSEQRRQDGLAKSAMTKAIAGMPLADQDKSALLYLQKRMDFEEDLSGPPFSIPQSVRDKGADYGVMPKGEDICFSDRVTAAGYKIYLDCEAICYHEKTIALQWPAKTRDESLSPDQWRVSEFGNSVEEV